MKHLKNFSLFESKSHKLPLPKNQAELDVLSESPGFQKLKDLKRTGSLRTLGSTLVMTRNGGVEITGPGNYNFKVSPAGSFYYGGLKVGPRHDTNLDSWDKLFDYVYLYSIGTGLNLAPTDSLENFVFHGVINTSLYSRIKDSEYYQSILEMARKYVGEVADVAVADAASKSSAYITDPSKVLETSSYKFFNKVFGFNPQIKGNSINITSDNITPFGIFNFNDLKLTFPYSLGARIFMDFSGYGGASTGAVKVKTLKGLDQSFLKHIINQYEESIKELGTGYYARRANDLSAAASKYLLEIFKTCIDSYIAGKDIPEIGSEPKNSVLRAVFYNWKSSNEDYIKSLVAIINDGKFNSVAEEISHSPKTIDILNSIKSEDPIKYSEIMMKLRDVTFMKDAIKYLYDDSRDVIKGGSLLRRFNT
jgi:hypothetical protein